MDSLINRGVRLSAIPPIPKRAEMLLGEDWSGWVWHHDTTHTISLLWREEGQIGGNYVLFQREEHFLLYLDQLGGANGHGIFGENLPGTGDDDQRSV